MYSVVNVILLGEFAGKLYLDPFKALTLAAGNLTAGLVCAPGFLARTCTVFDTAFRITLYPDLDSFEFFGFACSARCLTLILCLFLPLLLDKRTVSERYSRGRRELSGNVDG